MLFGLKGDDIMFSLTKDEIWAVQILLDQHEYFRHVAQVHGYEIADGMLRRLELEKEISAHCSNGELPTDEDRMNLFVEILYDYLVIETMNECRRGLLLTADLQRLEVLRTIFAKILANAPALGRELNIGSIYLVPSELVKIGLHKMLQFPEIELLHYARKYDGGMLRIIAQYMWQRDFGKKEEVIIH